MSYGPINSNLDFMQEIPHFFNPATGREEPINQGGFIDERPRTMEWNYERDGSNPLEDFGPIGTYNPDIHNSEVVPLDFLDSFKRENLATNYNDLKGWEKDILQCGLSVRSGSSWDKELCRLQKMYPGFMPRV